VAIPKGVGAAKGVELSILEFLELWLAMGVGAPIGEGGSSNCAKALWLSLALERDGLSKL
jgi:hypothetical protein